MNGNPAKDSFERFLGRYCRVEFRYSDAPVRTMEYDGMVERIVRGEAEEDHLVLNIRYGGRTPIALDAVVRIEELPLE